jgi:hypothetical protein
MTAVVAEAMRTAEVTFMVSVWSVRRKRESN